MRRLNPPPTLSLTRQKHLLMALSFVWFVAGLMGCSLGEAPVTYVVVTSTPTESPFTPTPSNTQPPSATPAPTFTPTPDIPPDTALKQADRAFLNGYYEDALAVYDYVLNRADTPSDVRAAAAFGKGHAAFRAGLFDQAAAGLTVLIDTYPQDYRAPLGYFVRGDAYLGLGNWTAAINDFRSYLQLRPGIIDSYAHERIGDAQLALGQAADALASYELASNQARGLASTLALREKVAQVYLSSGNLPSAVQQYDAILASARNAPYRAEIEYTAGKVLVDAGDFANGLARMQRVVNTYPGTAYALEALNLLLANGREVDAYQQGRVYYLNGEYASAIQAFNTFSSNAALADLPAELYLLLGRAYREVGNPSAALVAFETIVTTYPTDSLLGDALLEQGRTRFLSGDTDGAIQFYLRIASDYGYLSDTSAEALWRAGYLYGQQQRYSQSRETFTRLAERYPKATQAVSGLKIAAAQALQQGDSAGAELLYSQVAALATGADQADAYLQIGRLALQRTDLQTATLAFNNAIRTAPDSYYSARAADLRDNRPPFQAPPAFRFEFDDAAELTQAEDWLRITFNFDTPSPLWVTTPELEAEPSFIRGRELWLVGIYDAAETEFIDLTDKYSTDGLNSYRLAIYLRTLGAYYPSVVAAANVIRASGVSTLSAPAYIARMRYPAYYREVVMQITGERGIDPLLLYSLIRHESLFDADATAAAGEKGLTQVIPPTAEYIAQQLGWVGEYDLFRPYVSLKFGSYYLDEQLERFEGNVYAALAGYNAGPGRAISWLQLAGADPDVFMSTITIASTQLYIQRIYSHYAIYRALYGG